MTKRKAQSPVENHQKAHKQSSSTMSTLDDVMKKLEKLDKLDSIETSIKEIESTCEGIKSRQNTNETQINENTTNIEVIQSELEVLQAQMNKIHYEKIRNNIIIYGVPILEEENILDISLKICNSLLDTPLDNTSLLTRRMPIRHLSPPIIVQFLDPVVKSTIITNWKTLNNRTTNNIEIQQKFQELLNFTQPSKISITEEHTQYSHKLFKDTKEALGNKFKFIWIKFGYIYIRQSEGSPIHKIETRHQLHQFITLQAEEIVEVGAESNNVSSY